MRLSLSHGVNLCLLCCLIVIFCLPQTLLAQSHVVSTDELQKDIAGAGAMRRQNIQEVDRFFAATRAQKAMKAAHLDIQEVKNAVHVISDDDLARLAEHSTKTQRDFAAGALTNQQLTYIVIALATAVIILVAVKA